MNIIFATGTIDVLVNYKTVFKYIANLENDKYWRKEINLTTMDSTPKIGAVATESTYLSKMIPNNILLLKCTELVENKHVVYHTIPASVFYLKSVRKVAPIAENKTTITYAIAFDTSIVKHGLGFTLPTFIIDILVKRDLKKYLKKLKAVIEEAALQKH